MDKVPHQKMVSVNFSHGLFSLLDFLTLEPGTDTLSQNVSAELPLYTAYLRRVQTSCYLAMQALVWFHMVQFRAIQFGIIWFGASYMNLGWNHTF